MRGGIGPDGRAQARTALLLLAMMLVGAVAACANSVFDGFAQPASTDDDGTDNGASDPDNQDGANPEPDSSQSDGDANDSDANNDDSDGDAAGQGNGDPNQPDASPRTPTEPSAETLERVGQLEGTLLVEQGSQIVLFDPAGSSPTAVTDSVTGFNRQATWSPNGDRVAWTRITPDGAALVVFTVADGEIQVSDMGRSPAFYLSWSSDGDQIAFLRNSPRGDGVELGVVGPGEVPEAVTVASPFYIAWADDTAPADDGATADDTPPADDTASADDGATGDNPDAFDGDPTSRLAVHINGQSLAAMLQVPPDYASTEQLAVDLANPTGQFTAPVWLDATTVLAASPDGLARYHLESGDVDVVVESPGIYRFVVSPDRTRVAYTVELPGGGAAQSKVVAPRRQPTDGFHPIQSPAADTGAEQAQGEAQTDPETGPDDQPDRELEDGDADLVTGLVVVDLVTGDAQTATTQEPLAWEWSPDNRHLAWLDVAGPGLLRWHFWGSDRVEGVATLPFQPSEAVAGQYLPFFEQYTQSMGRWSPNGDAFVFAGRIGRLPEQRGAGVWVQLMDDDIDPVYVAQGDVVSWSPSGR